MAFAEGDDRLADTIAGGRRARALARREKERARQILAKFMTEHAEAAGRIAKARRDVVRRQLVKEIGPQGLVLAVDRGRRFEERPRERR